MVLLSELLEICKRGSEEKNIFLNVTTKNGEQFLTKMDINKYIADGIWFSEVHRVEDLNYIVTNDSFIGVMEQECLDDKKSWFADLYYAPMELLGDCELRFVNNISDISEDNNFDLQYDIIKITDDKDIIIYLKEI